MAFRKKQPLFLIFLKFLIECHIEKQKLSSFWDMPDVKLMKNTGSSSPYMRKSAFSPSGWAQ